MLTVKVLCLLLIWAPVCAGEALSKAEIVKTELEGELHKSRSEEAALKDALAKMQALNEGLGQDKIELNKIIMQVGGAV